MGVQGDCSRRLQAHVLQLVCWAVQYISVLFPGGSRMTSVHGWGESFLRPKRTDFQATIAVFNLP